MKWVETAMRLCEQASEQSDPRMFLLLAMLALECEKTLAPDFFEAYKIIKEVR